MSQTRTVGITATKIYSDNEHTCIKYHHTNVVKFNEREIILNSNGYRTLTTKTRMNQASNQYNLGYNVYQQDFEWFISYRGLILPFEDNIILDRLGTI